MLPREGSGVWNINVALSRRTEPGLRKPKKRCDELELIISMSCARSVTSLNCACLAAPSRPSCPCMQSISFPTLSHHMGIGYPRPLQTRVAISSASFPSIHVISHNSSLYQKGVYVLGRQIKISNDGVSPHPSFASRCIYTTRPFAQTPGAVQASALRFGERGSSLLREHKHRLIFFKQTKLHMQAKSRWKVDALGVRPLPSSRQGY